jgi:porin
MGMLCERGLGVSLRTLRNVAALLALFQLSQPTLAQTTESAPVTPEPIGLGNSPDDVDNQLAESEGRYDALFPVGPLEPLHRQWEDVTRRLEQDIGLELGLNYTVLYQNADASLSTRLSEAAVGDLDFFGRWNLVNRGDPWPGALVFFTENRHRFTDIPPSNLGGAIGSLWGTTNAFSQQDYALTQLYWEQGSREDRLVSRLGKMDPESIYDRSRYVSANEAFLNQAFSTTLAMPVPNTGLGAALAISPISKTYILGGVHDANGDKTSFGDIDKGELFTAIEFGVAPGHGKPGAGLYHVTLWHSDAREVADIPSGRGIALTLQQEIGPYGRIVPFFRYSYGEGGATPVRQAIATGVGFEEPFGQNNDLIGIGLSWGQPSDRALRDQYVLEAFYRFQVTPYTNLAPDIQVTFDPSENPAEETIVVGGIRLRTLF